MKKKLTPDEAAEKLAALIQEHFDQLNLTPAERKRRTKQAHDKLVERMKERLKWN